jgi:hypothetical protein
MTYDEVADPAFLHLVEPIEPGAAVSGSTLIGRLTGPL